MEKKVLFTIPSLYRDDYRINGYTFGSGEKAVCIVGAMRGNENQQLYACAKMVQVFKSFEELGLIEKDKQILIVPSVNSHSMNAKKRFWGIDNTDINRMFPGYDQGETTQRIAGALFQNIKDYEYGVQLASFYMPGNFVPHVRVMRTTDEPNLELLNEAKDFGLPYVVSHTPHPYDTATLNYNWQIWDTKAFSLYTATTETVDKQSAEQGIRAVLSFLSKRGIIKYNGHEGYIAKIINSDDIISIRASSAGFFDSFVAPGDTVRKGQLLANIIDSQEGNVIDKIYSNTDGQVFFTRTESKMFTNTAVYKIVPELQLY